MNIKYYSSLDAYSRAGLGIAHTVPVVIQDGNTTSYRIRVNADTKAAAVDVFAATFPALSVIFDDIRSSNIPDTFDHGAENTIADGANTWDIVSDVFRDGFIGIIYVTVSWYICNVSNGVYDIIASVDVSSADEY